jgi:DNA-binding NtrC family response regulator
MGDFDDADGGMPAQLAVGSEVNDLDELLTAYLADSDGAGSLCRSRPLALLLVEGDDQTRRILREMLEAAGHTVVTACSAGEAISLPETVDIDVILTDSDLPDATAFEVRDRMRSARPAAPVIVMSSQLALAETWSQSDLGALGFVEKPVRGLMLLAAIRDAALRAQ